MSNAIGTTRRAFLAGLLLASAATTAQAQRALQFPPVQSVTAQHGMVVAQEGRAALIGAEVLKRGGNAVDAAVAVGFAMAVTYPRAGNIGGGGFMLIHLAKQASGTSPSTTARPRRPRPPRIPSSMRCGEADPAKSRDLGLAIGVPGTVAGLTMALQKYGSGKFKLSRADRAGDRSRPQRLQGRRRVRGHRAFVDRADGALALDRETVPEARRLADRARHAAGAVRSRRARSTQSPNEARARSTKARSPTRFPPRCATPAG